MNNFSLSPQAAAQELLRRRNARSSLLGFTLYTFPGFEVNWHHRVLFGYLDRFIAGEIKRLMIFMPPRHTKSEAVSRRLPALILGQNPDARIIASSYGADLSSMMNRDVQRIIDSSEYARLFPETRLFGSNIRTVATGTYLRNSDIFEVVGYRGSYRSAGVGGGITGMGFDYGIIDDPIKNREEANSQRYRDMTWDWYRSVFYTRQEKNASILITLTRWHEDDMAGRILELAKSEPESSQWVILSLPAVFDDPATAHPDDPREIGEPLWVNKYNADALHDIRISLGSYEWNALYQQRPKAPEGNRFKRPWFVIVDAVPAKAKRIRYWDKAGTADGDGAATAGALLAQYEGITYIEDMVRGRWSSGEREKVIRQTAELDAQRYGVTGFEIWIEQEPGSGGKESAEFTIKNLSGYRIKADRPTGDKDTRLEPFAVQAEAGNVRVVRGDWNYAYIEEMCAIPYGKYRDQGDATSGAFNKFLKPDNAPRRLERVGLYQSQDDR